MLGYRLTGLWIVVNWWLPDVSVCVFIASYFILLRENLMRYIQKRNLLSQLTAFGFLLVMNTTQATAHSVAPNSEQDEPRNWRVMDIAGVLNMRASPSMSANILAHLSSGTLLDNLGCETGKDRTWCDVQELESGLRGYVAADYLLPATYRGGAVVTGSDNSALRAGRGDFDATGRLPCAQSLGQPMMQCNFGVARSGGGYATVTIDKPGGNNRSVYFRMGRPIGSDISEADYGKFSTERLGDLHIIHIGEERYEIPEAVVYGS